MDFVGGLPMTKGAYDYLYVVVDRFNKMCILMPCKNQVIAEKIANLFFQYVLVHFGIPTSIVSDRDTQFLGDFWTRLWSMVDTELKRTIAFHPYTDREIEVVNRTMVLFL
jgi:hypothetical protein